VFRVTRFRNEFGFFSQNEDDIMSTTKKEKEVVNDNDNDDVNDDTSDWTHFLQEKGDEFVSEEQRQEQLAQERRLARKRRLQQAATSSDVEAETQRRPKPVLEQQQQQQQQHVLPLDPMVPVVTKSMTATVATKIEQQHQHQQQFSTKPDTHPQSSASASAVPSAVPPATRAASLSLIKTVINYKNGNIDEEDEEEEDEEDDFDMFSSSVSPTATENDRARKKRNSSNPDETATNTMPKKNVDQQQDWDDAEGYYKATIGEIIAIEMPTTSLTTTSSSTNGNHTTADANGNKNDNNNDNNNQNANRGMEHNNGHNHSLLQFRVAGVIGKGVFSTVLKCTTEMTNHPTSTHLPQVVALKCVRHNETMAKAAYNEIRFLQKFISTIKEKHPHGTTTDPTNRTTTTDAATQKATTTPGIIPLLLPHNNVPLEFRGHTILIFPYMEYNLRDVLTKFGKGVGLSLAAVRNYLGQLFAAATHLKQHGLIHSDLKPDNILVSHDFSTVQLCDFGSAVQSAGGEGGSSSTAGTDLITPYLVSRFYRAPEIILGLVPTYAIDLWSLAVTGAELFLGTVLIQGKTNNDMIHLMMQHMGPVSNRLIRQHLVQTKRFPLKAHFQQEAANYVFRQETVDPVTGQAMHKNIPLVPGGSRSLVPTAVGGGGGGGDRNNNHSNHLYDYSSPKLQLKILKAKSTKDSRTMVLRFADLMQKCLTLDPSRRIAVKMALQHEFFKSMSSLSSQTEES
jgi:serine/threonine-protein kinase PRP4